jgi:hypothetical protein
MNEPAAHSGWHVPEPVLRRYADGGLDAARTWSVEVHLPGCATCRGRAADLVDPDHLRRLWREVEDAVDGPAPGVLERVLVRLGVTAHTARLLAATPSLRGSWLLSVVFALGFGVSTAYALDGPGRSLLFLTLAPLLPLAGVAVAYGPGVDPTYEIGLAAPLNGVRLLLVRVAAVLATTMPVITVASLLLPDIGIWAAGWLLPALALALVALVLGSFVPTAAAAAGVAAAWLGVALITVHPGTGAALPFSAAGQAGCAALAAAAAAGLALRRRRFDTLVGGAAAGRPSITWSAP